MSISPVNKPTAQSSLPTARSSPPAARQQAASSVCVCAQHAGVHSVRVCAVCGCAQRACVCSARACAARGRAQCAGVHSCLSIYLSIMHHARTMLSSLYIHISDLDAPWTHLSMHGRTMDPPCTHFPRALSPLALSLSPVARAFPLPCGCPLGVRPRCFAPRLSACFPPPPLPLFAGIFKSDDPSRVFSLEFLKEKQGSSFFKILAKKNA